MFNNLLLFSVFTLIFSSANANIDLNQKHIPGELIIKFKDNNKASSVVSLSAVEKSSFKSSKAKVYKFSPVVDLSKVIKSLNNDPNVEYVELNAVYELLNTPDDARFSELFGMNNEGQTGGTADADIDALEAWDDTIGSRDILVGVIDSGIDHTHPDIKDNYWINPGESGLDDDGNDKTTNGIDDDGNGYVDDFRGWDFYNNDNDPMDGNSHGTHVAGTIGAVGNNGIGVAGVNWEVSLVGLKIFSDSGRTTTEAIVKAIEYSTALGVDVTNNSWGGGPSSEVMQAAIREANEKDILFVAAAGNDGSNNDNRDFFPANYDIPNIISVAAVDHNDNLASFSNYGINKVDVGAPGVDILSTFPNNRYSSISGTSMAAPHVTGLVALIKSKFRDLTGEKLKARLLNTGDTTTALSNRTISGKRINARNALEIDNIAPNAPSNLVVSENRITSVVINFTPSGDDGEEGQAQSYQVKVSDQPISEDSWNEGGFTFPLEVISTSTSISMTIDGLEINSTGYIALRAVDNLGNVSDLSDNVIYQTKEVQVSYEDELNDLNGFSLSDKWGLENVDGNNFLTESPDGKYRNSINTSIVSNTINSNSNSVLKIGLSHDLENSYDYAYIEVSTDDEQTWSELASFTGRAGLANYSYDLKDVLGDNESFKIRFRVTSDSSQTRDGILIDKIVIISAID